MNSFGLCPSCQSKDLQLIEVIQTSDLQDLYAKFNVNIDELTSGKDSTSFVRCLNCDLKFFSPTLLGDDDFYGQLQKEDWYFLHEGKTEYQFSGGYVKGVDKVLDIGSGRGVFKKYIHCDFYQGLELSKKAVELAKKDGVNVSSELVEEHAKTHLGFYDVVVSFQVLEHVSAVQSFIQGALACLKPEGRLIIAVPNNDSFVGSATNNTLNLPPHHNLHWNEKSLRNLGVRFNLKVDEVFFEKVSVVHQHWYYQNLFNRLFLNIFFMKQSLVNRSLFYKLINRASLYLAMLVRWIKPNVNGHSIIMVYSRKTD